MQNKKGMILVFVLLMSSVIILTGTVLLSTTVMNYKMKKLNSKVKHVFYTSEAVMEEAYLISLGFIENALTYANGKDDSDFKDAYIDFLKGNCMDIVPSNSLTEVLKDKSSYIVYKDSCYKIDAKLTEKCDSFQLEIISTYSENSIDKKLKFICTLDNLNDKSKDSLIHINPKDLIHMIDWKVER